MSSPQIFTATDIDRYHRGEMSAAEMHALERAALDDPILADALDGYRHAAHAENDVQALRERFQQRLGETKKRRLVITGISLWRVAALFIVMAGGGWIAFQIFSGNTNKKVSHTNALPESTTQEATTDSATIVQLAPVDQKSDSLKRADGATASQSATGQNSGTVAQSTSPSPPPPATTDAGAMAEETKTAAASAPAADEADHSSVTALKSNVPVTTATEAPDTSVQQNVVLQRSQENRLPPTAGRTTERKGVIKENAAMAVPEGGWPAFEQYVKKNRKQQPPATDKATTDKTVELSFDVDGNSRPSNIVVTKSLCSSCDAESVRLLKEGPNWKTINAKGRVRIQF